MIKQFGQPIIYDRNGTPIKAKTQGQYELINAINDYDILFVNGPAGTGKTFLSICKAINALKERRYDRLIITRPAVESGEALGFLPGSLDEKIAPFMKPIFDSINKLKPEKNGNGRKKKKKVDDSEQTDFDWDKHIEICPLAYMRGITLDNSFIISDESQNMKISQMKMFLTRLGKDSKVVITGDSSQSDLNRNLRSGFRHAQKILNDVKGIGFITLTENDIVRHRLIKDIIIRYEKDTFRSSVQSNRDPS